MLRCPSCYVLDSACYGMFFFVCAACSHLIRACVMFRGNIHVIKGLHVWEGNSHPIIAYFLMASIHCTLWAVCSASAIVFGFLSNAIFLGACIFIAGSSFTRVSQPSQVCEPAKWDLSDNYRRDRPHLWTEPPSCRYQILCRYHRLSWLD